MKVKKINFKSNIIRVYLFVGMFVLCLCFLSCSNQESNFNNNKFYRYPIQTLNNITLYKSDNGIVYAELFSKKVDYYGGDSTRTIFPKGLKAKFLNKDLSTKAILTAGYAINYQKSTLVYLCDSITIINYNDKDTIYCKDLYWNQALKKVYTNKPIRRYSQSGQDFGDGLKANENFDSVEIKNPHGNEIFKED